MIKFLSCTLVGLVAVFCFYGTSMAADGVKIGIVDVQKVLMESTAGKAAQAKLATQGKDMEGKLKTKGTEIEELQKKLEKEKLVMSPEQFEAKQREVRTKVINFKDLQRNYLEDFKKVEVRALGQLKDDILAVIEEVGKTEGYAMIIERRDVLYMTSDKDITAQVISAYDKKPAASSK